MTRYIIPAILLGAYALNLGLFGHLPWYFVEQTYASPRNVTSATSKYCRWPKRAAITWEPYPNVHIFCNQSLATGSQEISVLANHDSPSALNLEAPPPTRIRPSCKRTIKLPYRAIASGWASRDALPGCTSSAR
jgi:hypothetical protein